MKKSARTRSRVGMMTLVIGGVLGMAIPAQAADSTYFNDVQNNSSSNSCLKNHFYSVVQGNWSQPNTAEIDFTKLHLGGRVDLPDGCGTVQKICMVSTFSFTAKSTVDSSAPFGAIANYYNDGRSGPTVAGSTAVFQGTQCADPDAGGTSARVATFDNENKEPYMDSAYSMLNSGSSKMTSFKISNYVKILMGSKWTNSPTSNYSKTL